MNTTLFHSLEGKLVHFKELSTMDVQAIHAFASDEDVSRFIGWSLMKTPDDTCTHIETMLKRESAGTHLYASVVRNTTQEVIGTAMLFNFDATANHAEIGYVFHKDHWGKGYGTESIALMGDFAFQSMLIHKLRASVAAANIGSARILEKNGFELEGRLKDHYFIEGRYYDSLLFGKLNSGR